MDNLRPQTQQPVFDVFLSHNSKEKAFVRKVKDDLAILTVKAWLDVDEMPPGTTWQQALEKGLKESRTVAVFIGEEGLGTWHNAEMQVAINQSMNGGRPVIPVLLPGCSDISELPLFLQNFSVVDFRKGLDNPVELKRLAWAITGEKPVLQQAPPEGTVKAPAIEEETEPEPDEQDASVQGALDYFEEVLDSVNLTYFIGQGINYSGIDSVVSPQKISRELMKNLQLIDPDYSQLLPTIDASAAYFAMGKTDTLLEKAVARQLMEAPDTVIPTYEKLADLLKLSGRRGPRRGQHINPQLIVTCNFDLALERCLLRAGLPFTRMVQYRASSRIDINEYKNVALSGQSGLSVDGTGGTTLQINAQDTGALDELIAGCNRQTLANAREFGSTLSMTNLTAPILYKINGSYDMPNSCLMTIDQHLDFIWRQGRQSLIPDRICEIIKNSPLLFIGSRILDPDFRLGYHAMLREETQNVNYQRFALLAKPRDGDDSDCGFRMLRKCWSPIKKEAIKRYQIEIIDIANERFLELLRERAESAIGATA